MDLEVVASGSCGGYRPLKRAPMAGTASIHLQTTLTGITYLVTVDVWDLDESIRCGIYDGHDIEIGGRRYETSAPLPGPVREAFWTSFRSIAIWMNKLEVTIEDVKQRGRLSFTSNIRSA